MPAKLIICCLAFAVNSVFAVKNATVVHCNFRWDYNLMVFYKIIFFRINLSVQTFLSLFPIRKFCSDDILTHKCLACLPVLISFET